MSELHSKELHDEPLEQANLGTDLTATPVPFVHPQPLGPRRDQDRSARTAAEQRLHRLQAYFSSAPNPYIAAAGPVVDLILVVNEGAVQQNPHALRTTAVREIEAFHHQLEQKSVSRQNIQIASYVLCSALDEAVLTTDWGSESDWRMETLLWTFHNDGSGGENVFKYVDDLAHQSERHLDLMELLVLLLDLGFQGHYRIAPNGDYIHETIRVRLHETIRAHRPKVPSPIHPPEPAADSSAPRRRTKQTVFALCAALALLVGYLNFHIRTQRLTAPLTERIELLFDNHHSTD